MRHLVHGARAGDFVLPCGGLQTRQRPENRPPPDQPASGLVEHDHRRADAQRERRIAGAVSRHQAPVNGDKLAIDEYLRMIRLFVGLGITKVRLTGGEPLLRRGLVPLIRELSALRTLGGEPLDLALTTNGHLLDSLAAPLKAAGLNL